MNITGGVGRTPAASNSGETKEDRSLLALLGEERSAGDVRPVGVRGEDTVSTGTASVDSTLGNTLMVEVLDLLAEDEVLEERGAALASAQAVLVRKRTANIAGQVDIRVIDLELRHELVRLLSISARLEIGVAGRHIASIKLGAHVGAANGRGRAREGGGESKGRQKHGC